MSELPPPAGSTGPPEPLRGGSHRELADRVPGAVAHSAYAPEAAASEYRQVPEHVLRLQGTPVAQPPLAGPGLAGPSLAGPPLGGPPLRAPRPDRPSGWNPYAFVMLGIFLLALGALIWPQVRARTTEAKIRPLVVGLTGRMNDSARCPRYITAIFTNVGSVSLDAEGHPSDHTDLTGPICDALRHFYTPAGHAELQCLLTDGRCPKSALLTVVALSTVAHESMHLRGQLDEAGAECDSIAEAPRIAHLVGLTPEVGRWLAYLHLMSLNPNTPGQYHLDASNCPGAAPVAQNPPGTPSSRGILVTATEQTWLTLGD